MISDLRYSAGSEKSLKNFTDYWKICEVFYWGCCKTSKKVSSSPIADSRCRIGKAIFKSRGNEGKYHLDTDENVYYDDFL